jgi:hypothetical protein
LWITENNIDKKSIRLIRFHNQSWQNLTTTSIREDNLSLYFRGETPGLSTFAVVGAQIIEIKPYGTIIPEIPWFIIIGLVIAASIVLVLFLFKGGYIYKEDQTKDNDIKGNNETKKKR